LRFAAGLPMNAGIPPPAVDLAREGDFRVGLLKVRPALREVGTSDRRDSLEPRVMRVLVLLARRPGEVISRDQLIAACWDGRIVGDDAINAAVAKVRRVGEAHAAFAIETIPRVGYRMVASAEEAASSAGPVLAVLAFDNLSDDPEMRHFSDGISEEILHAVSQARGLRVIGRTSSFRYRGDSKDTGRAARELGVTHVLDGSIRRDGSRIRVAAQLIEAEGLTTIWSGRLDRELADLFALQDEIATAIAQALEVALEPAVRPNAIEPRAYDLYIRAGSAELRIRPEHLRAVGLLEEATRLAPDFAAAWGRLARHRARLSNRIEEPEASTVRQAAREAADRALALGAMPGEAAAARIELEPLIGGYCEKERWLLRALADPVQERHPYVLGAFMRMHVGRLDAAGALIREAIEHAPRTEVLWMMQGVILFHSGRLAEARDAFERVARADPAFDSLTDSLLRVYSAQGDWAAFDRWATPEHLEQVTGRMGGERPLLFEALRNPKPATLARVAGAVRRNIEASGRLKLWLLPLLAYCGAADDAFRLGLTEPVATPREWRFDSRFQGMLTPIPFFNANFPELRRDRRFIQLCNRFDLVDYWLTTNSWPDCIDEVAPFYDFKAECRRVAARASA
jgi:TolB-like protein